MMTEPAPSKETLDGYVEVVNRSAEPALEKITLESLLTCGKSASETSLVVSAGTVYVPPAAGHSTAAALNETAIGATRARII